MLSPADVCASINNAKNSEKLGQYVDRIDLNKIDENSHGLTVKEGMYDGATLLLCALCAPTQKRWQVVTKIIEKARVGSIDIYVVLKNSDITVISLIPDYLMCDLIKKAKTINIHANWKKDNLLVEVLTEGHLEILLTLLQKGLVDLELFNACITDNEISQKLKTNILDIITKYLKVVRYIDVLPNPQAFNSLLALLSQNEWLLHVCQPNSKGVTFKDQIINRLNRVSQTQLKAFYKRFPQFKPADFQIEDTHSESPLLPPVNSAPVLPPQPHQNGVAAIKKELSLKELLYQGKHEILIERLQKGEIAFDLFEPFVADTPENAAIHYQCKNVIEVCLQWSASTFDLPKNTAFQKLLELFENNSWLFAVLDFSSKKSLLEVTRHKLQFKNKKQLEQFNAQFPNCDSLLTQVNSPEQERQDAAEGSITVSMEHSSDATAKNNVLKKSDEKSAVLKDPTHGASTDEHSALSTVAVPDDSKVTDKAPANGVTSSPADSAPKAPDDIPLRKQYEKAIADYSSAHGDSNGPASLMALVERERQKALKLQRDREELLRKQTEEIKHDASNIEGNNADGALRQSTSKGSNSVPKTEHVDNLPIKDLQQMFAEKKDVLNSEIYKQGNLLHAEKRGLIIKVETAFTELISGYGNNKVINENNRHDLLEVLCALYKFICEDEHKKKINIHNHPDYDRFFSKPNTKSWQEMIKDIRDKSLTCLLDIAAEQAKTNLLNAIRFMQTYINEPLFCEHRSNVAICRIGSTSAVGKIKDKIKDYEDRLSKANKFSSQI